MFHLSQTKKIALMAIALFFLSVASITFFLKNGGEEFSYSKANILQVGKAAEESKEVGKDNEKKDPNKEDRYREIIGNSKDPIIVINVEGMITFVSNDFCKLLSMKCSNVLNNLLFEFINSEDLPAFVSAHAKLIAEGQKNEALGPFRMSKNKKEILVLLSAQPIVEDKKVTAIVMAAKDLSEQVDAIKANENDDAKLETNNVDKTLDILDKISFAY
ncbi:PAS domain S-box protein [Candidatus Peregrinibacteria bacterium]|nr:PAS domain S-box protein [Candidatus Peregrinibacteria bacterium]